MNALFDLITQMSGDSGSTTMVSVFVFLSAGALALMLTLGACSTSDWDRAFGFGNPSHAGDSFSSSGWRW